MKRAGFISTGTAATFMMLSQSFAQEALVVNDMKEAETMARYLAEWCPKTPEEAQDPDIVKDCISAGMTITARHSQFMKDFISETKTFDDSFLSGQSVGELLACDASLDQYAKTSYAGTLNMVIAGAKVLRGCVSSFHRAQDNLGLSYHPEALNTINNFVTCLEGKCAAGTNSPLQEYRNEP